MKTKQMEFLQLLDSYVSEYMPVVAGMSENTIRLYKATFRLLFEFLYETKEMDADKVMFRALDYETLTAFLSWLENERKCSVATRNVRLSALRAFAAYAQNRNFDAALIFRNSVSKIPVKREGVSQRAYFTREELSILLRTPDSSTKEGRRDVVLLSLMYASGARAQEICDLTVRNVIFEKDSAKLILSGKGRKTRRITIAPSSAAMLKEYLLWRGIAHNLDRHVFSSRTHEKMTVSCVEAIYKKHLAEAKRRNPSLFHEKSYSPHSMRHTCAMHMLEAGIPLMAIKNFLGHAFLTTTEQYARLTQGAVDKHIKEWNEKWFKDVATPSQDVATPSQISEEKKCVIPEFLR